jgi:pimeloyl-ACP methyl ester carboxylesterase
VNPQAWLASGSFFEHRPHRIFWREGGRLDAPTLLLIHGYPTSSWDWAPIWPLLQAEHHLLTLDMLGFGHSSKPKGHRYSIPEQADLCEALLRRQGVTQFHILAHDYGDTVAQELLARHNESSSCQRPRLLSLALLNGGLFPETHRARFVQKLLASPLGPAIAGVISKRSFAKTMTGIFGPDTPPSAEHIDGFWELATRDNGRAAMARLISYISERRAQRERWVGALQRSSVPLQVINGALDPVSGAHMVARYRELVPNPDVTSLPRIGHYPQVEDPQGVATAYAAFRAKLSTSPARP